MPDLLYEKKDYYAIFTMNRPARLNALGGTLNEERAGPFATSTPTRRCVSVSSPAPAARSRRAAT